MNAFVLSDVIFLAATVSLFLAAALYARFCGSL